MCVVAVAVLVAAVLSSRACCAARAAVVAALSGASVMGSALLMVLPAWSVIVVEVWLCTSTFARPVLSVRTT